MNLGELSCSRCGAPADPSVDACPYCQAKRRTLGPTASLDPAAWEQCLVRGSVAWGPPLVVTVPPSPNNQVALRSHALLDDVNVFVEYRFDAGQGWVPGLTSTALGVCVRASTIAGYDVSVSVVGLLSISRTANGRLEEWLLEPAVHATVHDGIGATNRLSVSMIGDRISVTLNGRSVASVRDGTRRSGAVELQVRPGAADARLVVSSLSVTGP